MPPRIAIPPNVAPTAMPATAPVEMPLSSDAAASVVVSADASVVVSVGVGLGATVEAALVVVTSLGTVTLKVWLFATISFVPDLKREKWKTASSPSLTSVEKPLKLTCQMKLVDVVFSGHQRLVHYHRPAT